MNKISVDYLHTMLYDDQTLPEIQIDVSVQNEANESESLPVERSPMKGLQVNSLQVSSVTKVEI